MSGSNAMSRRRFVAGAAVAGAMAWASTRVQGAAAAEQWRVGCGRREITRPWTSESSCHPVWANGRRSRVSACRFTPVRS